MQIYQCEERTMNKQEIQDTLNKIKKDIEETTYIHFYDSYDCIRRLVALIEEIIDTN